MSDKYNKESCAFCFAHSREGTRRAVILLRKITA